MALDVVEVFRRRPVVDRLTLRLMNLGQVKPEDFEGGEKGLRLPEVLRRFGVKDGVLRRLLEERVFR